MTDDVIPGDLRDFILRHIDSVAQLEALLLLRANPNEDWDVKETATRVLQGTTHFSDESEPFLYVPRLLTFALIILAIVQKNRPSRG
jgi:hypothetical protein